MVLPYDNSLCRVMRKDEEALKEAEFYRSVVLPLKREAFCRPAYEVRAALRRQGAFAMVGCHRGLLSSGLL